MESAEFELLAPVGGLGPGTHEVTLTANLPVGLTLVSVEPATVTVTIAPARQLRTVGVRRTCRVCSARTASVASPTST